MANPPRYRILLEASTVLFGLAILVWYVGKKRPPYPPGPRCLPIVGNIFGVPSREEWVTYRKWSEESGTTLYCYHLVASRTVPSGSDVVHVDMLGSHIVIPNSIKVANDLLDKRSSIYSDRYDTATGSRITRLCHLLIQHTSQTANGGPAKAVRQTGTFIVAF
jgi:hypothetical protein